MSPPSCLCSLCPSLSLSAVPTMPCTLQTTPALKSLESAQCLCFRFSQWKDHKCSNNKRQRASQPCSPMYRTIVCKRRPNLSFHQPCMSCSDYLDGAPKPGTSAWVRDMPCFASPHRALKSPDHSLGDEIELPYRIMYPTTPHRKQMSISISHLFCRSH